MGKGCCKLCKNAECSWLTELVYCTKHRFSIHEFHEPCEEFEVIESKIGRIGEE